MQTNVSRFRYVDPRSRIAGYWDGAMSSLMGGGAESPLTPTPYPQTSPEMVDMHRISMDMYAAFLIFPKERGSHVRR